MITVQQLNNYMSGFLGYGNLAAPIWFVGMEEGGGKSAHEFELRVNSWHTHQCEVSDMAEHHCRIGMGNLFEERTATQSTWRKLSATILCTQLAEDPTMGQIRAHQVSVLGRAGSDAALLELFPLPKQKRDTWKYAEWYPDFEVLSSRDTYEAAVIEARINRIRDLIQLHNPKVVIFYGLEFKGHWTSITGLEGLNDASFLSAVNPNGSTTFYLSLPHPVSFGHIAEKFAHAGRTIRRLHLLD